MIKKKSTKYTKNLLILKYVKNKSLYYENLELDNFHFKCNLSIARGKLSDDPWFILSNIEPINLEKTKTRNLHAYENLYSLVCFAGLWLTIIGIDYTKNYIHVKNKLNIRYVKNNKNGKPIRILSLFNLGLTIFKRCYNSYINYKIKTNMQLYL